MEERDELTKIFANPVFVKAWRNLRAVKPGVFISQSALASPAGPQMANNRFHEIRGWEMFAAALLKQAKEPEVKRTPAKEEYPDAGTIEAEMRRTSPPIEPRKVPGAPPPGQQMMPIPKVQTVTKIRKP